MTEPALESIADLLRTAELGGSGGARSLAEAALPGGFVPLAVLQAERQGRLLAIENLQGELGADEAARLAQGLPAAVRAKRACAMSVPGQPPEIRLLALALPPEAEGRVLGFLVRCERPIADTLGELEVATRMALALGAAAVAHRQADARLRTRIEHLLAEIDALKASHAEAVCETVAEREELRRLHLQNAMILNAAAEGIVGTDESGLVVFANPTAARMLGCAAAAELVGRPVADFAPDWILADKLPGSRDRREAAKPRPPLRGALGNEVEFQRRDGSVFPAEHAVTSIAEGGAAVGAVITFRDISERRMLEAQLRQAQKLESIGQLAAGIAHEINTPTQYIGDNTRFLQDAFKDVRKLLAACRKLCEAAEAGPPPPEVVAEVVHTARNADAEYLLDEVPGAIRQTLDGVERVAAIVHSMKEFSHPGSQDKQAIDLNRAIESTVTISRNEWKYVAELETDFDPELPLVTCFPGEFNQVVLNLIINAAHAIADKLDGEGSARGTIRISTRRDGAWVEVRVQDTGTGIPEAVGSRVFDPFFTTKPVGRGTGQGLALAHSIVTEKHGGRIRFETEPGQGTTFILRIPILSESG